MAQTAENGLPGDHHFYLTFDTNHPRVELSAAARNVYPHEMTIVLQHQFWDLVVDDELFAVTLRFGGVKQRIVVPFEALKTFVDPAAEFGLNLELVEDQDEGSGLEVDRDESGDAAEPSAGSDRGGDVVSIDRFRKRPP